PLLYITLAVFILNPPIRQRNKLRNPNTKLTIITFLKAGPSPRLIRPSPPLKPPESRLGRGIDSNHNDTILPAKLIDLLNAPRTLIDNKFPTLMLNPCNQSLRNRPHP